MPDKAPHIAISVDMLDTGIDVPEVVNLVFFKIVRSKTKFWQMIGRGTRLCPDLFGPGQHKEFFYVFDFCQNFEFFNQNPELADGTVGASLSEKLFRARLDLTGLLGKADGMADPPAVFDHEDGEAAGDVRQQFLDELHAIVDGMTLDNFVVRPHRRMVEKYQDKKAWAALSAAERAELADEVAGLPTSVTDDDIAAKQFDLLVLNCELALLRQDKAFVKLKEKITGLAAQLELLSNVPMVAAQLELILEVQAADYWQDITVPMLESMRRKLRSLIKLIEPKRRKIVVSDFEDEIGEGEEISLPGVATATDKGRFLRKVRHFLTGRRHHDPEAPSRRAAHGAGHQGTRTHLPRRRHRHDRGP